MREPQALDLPRLWLGKRSPRFYYGWLMVPVALVGILTTSPGQSFGIAAFNESFRASLRISHSQLTAAYMLGTIFAALPLSFLGIVMDRYGLRKTTTLAVVLLGLACLVAATANGILMLFVAFFLLRLLGPGAMSLLSSSMLAFWFQRRLGMVEGIRHLGLAAAIGAVPCVNLWLIDQVGWRGAFVFLGVAVWCLMLPLLVFVFRDRPEDVGQVLDGQPARHDRDILTTESRFADSGLTFSQATRCRSFWIVLVLNALWGMVGTALTFNIVPILEARGLNERAAAELLSIFAVSLALTHLIGGMLADRLPLHRLLAMSVGCMLGVTWLLGFQHGPWLPTACGSMMGVAQGLSTGITSLICVRYFGRSHLGQIRGSFSTATIAASSLGPFLVGFSRDWTGSYTVSLGFFTLLTALGLLASFFATAPRAFPVAEPLMSATDRQTNHASHAALAVKEA
ncbi:MAG: MFS transporter [Gemmataceae bacterium]